MQDPNAVVCNAMRLLTAAMIEGRLDARCDTSGLSAGEAEAVSMVNRMLDALIAPMRMAAHALQEIAHGRLPEFIVDDYQGEFNDIKQSVNTLLAILYGMHKETKNLTDCVSQGNLRIRGNDWDYEGIWRELISGVNGTLDAVVTPIEEAREVLGRLANYDLSARMQGKYYGDHAVMRNAMRTTAEALNEAVSQVANTVELVSSVGSRISEASTSVLNGATTQSNQLADASNNLGLMSQSSEGSARKTNDAKQKADIAAASISQAKEAMDKMLEAMAEIRASTDSTAEIVGEIDKIAEETGALSDNAKHRATKMRSSAGGFGIVAGEIQNLSQQCAVSADKMLEFRQRLQSATHLDELDLLHRDLSNVISELQRVAISSNLLGVNAAIEGAHVEGAGNDFKTVTTEIHDLAERATEAAKKTEEIIRMSAETAAKGEELSLQIAAHLAEAVRAAQSINNLTDSIAEAASEQAASIDHVNAAVAQISIITKKNAASSSEWAAAATDLEGLVGKLGSMVEKFQLRAA